MACLRGYRNGAMGNQASCLVKVVAFFMVLLARTSARADFLYGVTDNSGLPQGNGLLLRIDPQTAVGTVIGDTGFQGIEDVAAAPNGQLLATAYPGTGLAFHN